MVNEKINLPSEFLNEMKTQLGKDYEKYLISMQNESVRGLRVNTIKISVSEFLNLSNLQLEKIKFSDDGFIIRSDEKLGNTPNHLSGLYYLQEPSSMIPVIASEIEKENRPLKVLDLCSSPGGKTGQIAMRVSEDSVIFSNEIVSSRAQVLYANTERQGLKNVIILNESPERLGVFKNYFDYVFVDAPCSGEGMFRKNPETINEWNKNNSIMCADRQKEILNIAKTLVKPKGKLIYSTCTFSKREDEDIVSWFLGHGDFDIIDVPEKIKEVTIPATGEGLESARKFLPYTGEGEGQFVAVFRCNREYCEDELYSKKHFRSVYEIGQSQNKLVKAFAEESLTKTFSWRELLSVGDSIYLAPIGFDSKIQTTLDELRFVSIGTKLGEIAKDRFVPNHSCFMALPDLFKTKFELSDDLLKKYLHGEELEFNGNAKGYAVVTKNGYAIGGVKISGNRLKNLYPKGLRIWNIH